MDIYIKPIKKASIAERNTVLIKDIADVVATADVAEKVKNMKVLDIPKEDAAGGKKNKKHKYLVSVTDIVKVIKKTYPDYTVNNLGEMDTMIDYSAEKSVDNKIFEWFKIAFVAIVLLVGSSTAIMSFHSDAQMPEVFKNYYKIFFGEQKEKPLLIDIPYSVGMATGIIVFYNHFAGKKATDDPTPIEVEMSAYETDVITTVIDVLDTRKQYQKDVEKHDGH